jgi:hypothetical protein
MPPSKVSVPSKSHIRNEKRKRARQLQAVNTEIQKNHTARIEKELIAAYHDSLTTKGELTIARNEIDRLQNIAQSAVLDSYIAQRS